MDNQTLLTLGSSIISAVSAIIAASAAGYWGYRAVKATSDEAKLRDDVANLKKELIISYRQIAAYHQLEHEFSTHLSQDNSVAPKTVKTDFRNRVMDLLGERPEITRKRAETRIRELEAS